jgi:hypothetical protein
MAKKVVAFITNRRVYITIAIAVAAIFIGAVVIINNITKSKPAENETKNRDALQQQPANPSPPSINTPTVKP